MKHKPPLRKFALIDSGLYSTDILFTIGTTEAEIRNELARRLKRPLTEAEESALTFKSKARTVQLEGGACVMWLSSPSLSLLAHEVFHAAVFILERAGIPLTNSSDEAYAYLIEHITRKAVPILQTK